MALISSGLFWIFLISWSALIPIVFLPALILNNRKIADEGAKIWAVVILWVLKKLCKIDHEIRGLENLPKESCIIACKHQSMWETIVMHLVLKHPVYAFKKELLAVPFYGWYLRVMSGITVDRKGGASALKDLIKQSKKYLSHNQSIVIFPQGTRVPVDVPASQYPYQAGIAALYLSCGVRVVPVALNSGLFWPKSGKIKRSGKIILELLEPIEPGLSKQEFMLELERKIEESSRVLGEVQF